MNIYSTLSLLLGWFVSNGPNQKDLHHTAMHSLKLHFSPLNSLSQEAAVCSFKIVIGNGITSFNICVLGFFSKSLSSTFKRAIYFPKLSNWHLPRGIL